MSIISGSLENDEERPRSLGQPWIEIASLLT